MAAQVTEADGADEEQIISSWGVTVLCLDMPRYQVQGQWTQHRIPGCLPELQRFFCHRKRQKREHQETDIRDWLEGRGVNSRIAHQKEA